MSTHYSLVEFSVRRYKNGERVYDEPYLWEGTDAFDIYPDCGEWEKPSSSDFVHKIRTGFFDQNHDREYFVPDKDLLAIVNIEVLEEGVLGYEYKEIGNDVFEGFEREIIELAKTANIGPRDSYGHFLTLWKVTVETYRDYESMYEEYDLTPELIGIVKQGDLAQLAKIITQ